MQILRFYQIMETTFSGSQTRTHRQSRQSYTRRHTPPTIHNHKTNKIISRLTYNPVKHKQQFTRKLRNKLSTRPQTPIPDPVVTTTLSVGSVNINGLDMEATWAAQQLLDKYQLDVSKGNSPPSLKKITF